MARSDGVPACRFMRWFQLRFDFDSTFDCLSEVINNNNNNNNNTSICKAHNVSIRAESEAPVPYGHKTELLVADWISVE